MERYPEFLPWCSDARLISKDGEQLCGEIEVSRLGVTQRFSTCNRLHPPERMELRLREGPFRTLEGRGRSPRCARMPARWRCGSNSSSRAS